MPVVTSQGLVGRVIEVSSHVSVVQLLTDRDSQVGALVQSSRDAGTVSGQGNQTSFLSLMLFARDAVVNVDDAVVTSGLGEIYPPGLYVGRVVKVTKDRYGLLKYASIQSGVEFGRLEEVLVITTPRQGDDGGGGE
jgi:rod shape-determining protein MreC